MGDPSHSPLWNRVHLGAIGVYLLCACVMGFRSPGMYYDEAIFLNGAVQVVSSGQEPTFAHDPWSWVTVFGRRWPIMVMPYVGPMRDYLAIPPFALFGPNYFSARMLAALMGAFGIWGFSILIQDQFDARTAALASCVLAIHPAYLALTVYGSMAEWMVPTALLSIAVARFARAKTARRAFWLGVAMGFGVWTRANIIWMLGSLLVAGVIVLGRRMWIPLRQWAALAAGGVIGGAPLLWYEIRSRGATLAFIRSSNIAEPLSHLVSERLKMLSQTLLSDAELRLAWGGPPLPLWQPLLFSAVVAFAIASALWSGGLPQSARTSRRVAALSFLFLLACMLFSRLNISDHHLISLIPIAAVLAVAAAQDTLQRWPSTRYGIAFIGVACLGSALYWDVAAVRSIRSTGGVGLWSNAIDKVTVYLRRNVHGKQVKVLDWGLNNNIFVLSAGKIASTEIFWGATVERSGFGKLWQDEISPGDVYLLHAPEVAVFPQAAQGFRQALAASALPFRRTQFRQKSGAGYAEVLEILAPTP